MPEDNSLHGVPESGEFFRWQGGIDKTLETHGRRLDLINSDVHDINNKMSSLKDEFSREMQSTRTKFSEEMTGMKVSVSTDMAGLKAKVAMFSAIGGLVGAGVVSLVFSVLLQDPGTPGP